VTPARRRPEQTRQHERVHSAAECELLKIASWQPMLREIRHIRRCVFMDMSPREENIRSVWLALAEPNINEMGMTPGKFSALCVKFGIDARASARLSSNGYVWTDDLNRYWRGDGTRGRTGNGTGKVAKLIQGWVAHEADTLAERASMSTTADLFPDGRYRRPGTLTVRLGQDRFRSVLIDLYGCKCWISGCAVEEVLQAAHVEPHSGTNNRASNGMLLRADLHNLYDARLLWIEPVGDSYYVRLSPVLRGAYAELADKRLSPPQGRRDDHPDRNYLLKHRPIWYNAN
jgi:hypothetical protein